MMMDVIYIMLQERDQLKAKLDKLKEKNKEKAAEREERLKYRT